MKRNVFALMAAALTAGLMSVSARTMNAVGDLPLFFEGNAATGFSARSRDAEFSVSPAGARIVLQNAAGRDALQLRFPGAATTMTLRGDSELSGRINYLVGRPEQWRSGVPLFSRVRVEQLYPGVDLVYHGNERQLEYDFEIAPGADPAAITLRFDGAEKVFIDRQGRLVLKLKDGEIIQPAPEIFQVVDGGRKTIAGGYHLLGGHDVAFVVGDYDRSRPLVIDPTFVFSTYFGGTAGETAWAVALGSDGSIYVAGQTFSKRFDTNGPAFDPFSTAGAVQETFGGGKLTGDGFLARFDSSGTNLVYLTYFGGENDDYISGVAVDTTGDAFVAGFTSSSNFPTVNALYPNIGSAFNKKLKVYASDAFVAEFDPSGSNLVYSTYLGGNGADAATGIAIDGSGDAYVTGITGSTNFPTVSPLAFTLVGSTNPALNRLAGTNDAFVTEIAPGGASILFSTYLGGNNIDIGEGIAVDSGGFIYVSGFTCSTNFPATNYITQTIGTNTFDGHLLNNSTNRTFNYDAFVTKLQPSGFVYSTLLGGKNNDFGYRIASDGSGDAYVVGYSLSPNFPNTAGTNVVGLHSFTATNTSPFIQDNDAFLAKISPAGTNLVYSLLFGGRSSDIAYGVAVDTTGNAFITGVTQSTNFPVVNAITTTNAGKPYTKFPADAFVASFDPAGATVLYSTYLGGAGNDYGYAIAVDGSDKAFVVGQTTSTNFPRLNPYQNFRNGTNDTFLVEIAP